MKNKTCRNIYFFFIFILANLSLQAKPVNIDEIVSKEKQLRLLPSISYINLKSKNPLLSSISYQMPDGSYINIPVSSYANLNQDYLNFNVTARYGIYNRVELLSSLSAFWQYNHTDINGNFNAQSYGNFNTWNLGLLVEAKKEGKLPSLLLGGNMDIMSMAIFNDTSSALQYFRGYSFFVTSFYTVDPIVFLVQMGLRINLENRHGNVTINNGEIFFFNPMVYFAINPYVSLNFGIKYQYKTQDSVNGVVVAKEGSSIAYNFGVAYEIQQNLIIFASVERLETNQYTSNTINLMLSCKI